MKFVTDDCPDLYAIANRGKIQNIWYYDGLYDDENQIYAYLTNPDKNSHVYTLSPLIISPEEQEIVGHYSLDKDTDKYVGFMFADNIRNIQRLHTPMINLAHINQALEKLCDCDNQSNLNSDKYLSCTLTNADILAIENTLNTIKTHKFVTPNDKIIYADIFENTQNKQISKDL